MGNILNAGNVNHGVKNSVTINGIVYPCKTTSPKKGTKQLERENQEGYGDGLVMTRQRATCSFELTIPTPTTPIPDVLDTFTYQHDSTNGVRTWAIDDASETYTVGDLSKISITCRDITGMSVTTE